MKPLVVPVFISHQGCPHRCIFCDQYTITGYSRESAQPVNPEMVRKTIQEWLYRSINTRRQEIQVAFYGGSFTALPIQSQEQLLDAVRPFVRAGEVDCVRISTRPDYIDETVVSLLKEFSVTIVELGIQSLHQDVLAASCRGHTVRQSEEALRLLKVHGFKVGAQLMCGLPGDSSARALATARSAAELGPDFVRIYPTLVIKGSGLEKLYRSGAYRPMSLPRAVALCSRIKAVFDEYNIKVVRLGLQHTSELAAKVVAGPYHPALGELVMARSLFKKTREILGKRGDKGKLQLHIAAADESAFRGPGNSSIKRLKSLGLLENVQLVFDRKQARYTVSIS